MVWDLAEKQLPLWTNVGLPGKRYGRTHHYAFFASVVKAAPKRHTSYPGAEGRPGFVLHVGQEQPDSATDARAVPIYQTTSYVFRDCAHAAARFGLEDPGNIYGRLTNPTQEILEKRLAALEGGTAALALASGAAAITYTIQALAQAGDHIVAQKTIYGGSFNLLAHTLPQFGITATFVDAHSLSDLEDAVQSNTKAIYLETLGNPNSDIPDIESIAAIAHKHGLPLRYRPAGNERSTRFPQSRCLT